jgi:hypothetical protein
MGDDVEVRLYRPGDEVKITRLFKEVFGREMSLEEWRWKYKRQGSGAVYASVAEDDDHKILGHYGAVPFRMHHRDKEIKGASIGDVMIHQKFRGIKNLKALTHKIEDILFENDFLMVYGFPNEKALMIPAEKTGLFERVEEVFDAWKEVCFHNNRNRFLYKLFPLRFEDTRIPALWHSARKELNLSVIRDREYLQWRYRDHPLFSYELWGLRRRSGVKLLGLAIIKRSAADKLMVMDIVFRKDFFIPLMEKIENLGVVSGVKTLNLWLPQEYHPVLRGIGFAIHPAGTTIPCTTHPGFLNKDDIRGKFFYTMGDTDFL